MGKKALGAVGEGVNSLAGNWARSKLNQAKGLGLLALGGRKLRDEKGNVVGYQARFKIPGFTHTRTVTKDANGVWTQNKETHQKTAADKMFKPMKDENGDTVFGVKTGRNQYEQMEKSVDAATGNIIYTSQDGQSKLITDKDGNILQYKGSSDKEMKNEVHNGSVRTINDSLMKKRVMTDANGNVIGTDVSFKNVSSKYLINKDGSTNMHAFNQIMIGVSAENKADAMAAMVDMHMAARGQNLDNRFKNRKVEMDKDGSISITQTNHDGSTQLIKAKMIDGQMVIDNKSTDKNGNITSIKSNGILTKTVNYELQKDGSYKASTRYTFTDEAHSRSRLSPPLDKEGVWGYGIDPNKAMAGFNKEEFDEHIKQIRQKGLYKKLYTAEEMKNLTEGKAADGEELTDEFYGDKGDGGKGKSPKAQEENLQKEQMKHELFRLNEEYQKVHTEAMKLQADAKNAQSTRDAAKAKMDSAKALANRTNDPQDIAAFKRAEAEYQSNLSRYNKLVAEYTKLKNENNNLVTNINNMQGMYNGLATPTSSETVSENKGNKK